MPRVVNYVVHLLLKTVSFPVHLHRCTQKKNANWLWHPELLIWNKTNCLISLDMWGNFYWKAMCSALQTDGWHEVQTKFCIFPLPNCEISGFYLAKVFNAGRLPFISYLEFTVESEVSSLKWAEGLMADCVTH